MTVVMAVLWVGSIVFLACSDDHHTTILPGITKPPCEDTKHALVPNCDGTFRKSCPNHCPEPVCDGKCLTETCKGAVWICTCDGLGCEEVTPPPPPTP